MSIYRQVREDFWEGSEKIEPLSRDARLVMLQGMAGHVAGVFARSLMTIARRCGSDCEPGDVERAIAELGDMVQWWPLLEILWVVEAFDEQGGPKSPNLRKAAGSYVETLPKPVREAFAARYPMVPLRVKRNGSGKGSGKGIRKGSGNPSRAARNPPAEDRDRDRDRDSHSEREDEAGEARALGKRLAEALQWGHEGAAPPVPPWGNDARTQRRRAMSAAWEPAGALMLELVAESMEPGASRESAIGLAILQVLAKLEAWARLADAGKVDASAWAPGKLLTPNGYRRLVNEVENGGSKRKRTGRVATELPPEGEDIEL